MTMCDWYMQKMHTCISNVYLKNGKTVCKHWSLNLWPRLMRKTSTGLLCAAGRLRDWERPFPFPGPFGFVWNWNQLQMIKTSFCSHGFTSWVWTSEVKKLGKAAMTVAWRVTILNPKTADGCSNRTSWGWRRSRTSGRGKEKKSHSQQLDPVFFRYIDMAADG